MATCVEHARCTSWQIAEECGWEATNGEQVSTRSGAKYAIDVVEWYYEARMGVYIGSFRFVFNGNQSFMHPAFSGLDIEFGLAAYVRKNKSFLAFGFESKAWIRLVSVNVCKGAPPEILAPSNEEDVETTAPTAIRTVAAEETSTSQAATTSREDTSTVPPTTEKTITLTDGSTTEVTPAVVSTTVWTSIATTRNTLPKTEVTTVVDTTESPSIVKEISSVTEGESGVSTTTLSVPSRRFTMAPAFVPMRTTTSKSGRRFTMAPAFVPARATTSKESNTEKAATTSIAPASSQRWTMAPQFVPA
eukprot:4842533-Amphidinium_carterae.1